jgi:hypothetical protein
MKAAAVPSANSNWVVKEINPPEPGENQVLIKIRASGSLVLMRLENKPLPVHPASRSLEFCQFQDVTPKALRRRRTRIQPRVERSGTLGISIICDPL